MKQLPNLPDFFKNLVGSSFASLVSGRVCLGKPGEVIDDDQDIIITTTTGLKVEEVNADKFKW